MINFTHYIANYIDRLSRYKNLPSIKQKVGDRLDRPLKLINDLEQTQHPSGLQIQVHIIEDWSGW
jgi:hypothetical protein